jgi:hypothetical protein
MGQMNRSASVYLPEDRSPLGQGPFVLALCPEFGTGEDMPATSQLHL